MKRYLSGFLAAVLLLTGIGSSTVFAGSRQTVTYTQANEVCEVCYLGYNEGVKGPIVVTKGKLITKSASKEIYLITLSGTEQVKNQSTGFWTDLKAGFNQDNAYLKNVVSVIKNNIPTGSNLILSGHSLGGMVAQQVAANTDIKSNYQILNTVTFGSPLISAGSREGTVKRLGDTADVVPYLSATGHIIWQICGLNRENGGYGSNVIDAHLESYLRSDVWGSYDVLGYKNGTASMELDLSTQTYFQSPTN